MNEDRWLIIEALNSYAWGYDSNDMDMFGNSFTKDAVYTIELANGTVLDPVVGRNTIVDTYGAARKADTDQKRHRISNVVFLKLEESYAKVMSSVLVTSAENSQLKFVTSGKYIDELVKESDGAWRIETKYCWLDT